MIIKYEFDGTIIDSIKNDKHACEFAHDNRHKIVKKFVWYVDENYDNEFEPDETEKIYEYKETNVNFEDCKSGEYDFCISKYNRFRYVIVDKQTGEILDDARGNGYSSEEKAFNGYRYKCCRGFLDPSKNYIFKEFMDLDDLIEKSKSFKEINEVFKKKNLEKER